MVRNLIQCCVILFVLSTINLYSQTINLHKSVAGFETGATVSVGAYKSYINYFFNLNRKSATKIYRPEMEKQIYPWLISRILRPRYIVFQLTNYPLVFLSSEMETFHPENYNRLEFKGMNLLRSIGSGFEEPYALSLLFGNFALFGRREQIDDRKYILKQSGSALAGIMITTGHLRIQDNIRINDRWWQVELIVTGVLNESRDRKLEWNFRIGTKHHQVDLTPDVAILVMYRNHTDWSYNGLSLFRNSRFQYEAHFPIADHWRQHTFTVKQHISYGKKFPFKMLNHHVAIRLGGGVIWERLRLYNHDERYFEQKTSTHISYLIQPSIEF